MAPVTNNDPMNLHHVVRLLGALAHGLGDVDEQRLIGSRQQRDERGNSVRLAYHEPVWRVLR